MFNSWSFVFKYFLDRFLIRFLLDFEAPCGPTLLNCNKKSKISSLWLINSFADFRTSIFAPWAGRKFLQA